MALAVGPLTGPSPGLRASELKQSAFHSHGLHSLTHWLPSKLVGVCSAPEPVWGPRLSLPRSELPAPRPVAEGLPKKTEHRLTSRAGSPGTFLGCP